MFLVGWDFDTLKKGMSRDNSIASLPSQDDYGIIVMDNSFTVSASNGMSRKDSQSSMHSGTQSSSSSLNKTAMRSLARAMLDLPAEGMLEGKVQSEELSGKASSKSNCDEEGSVTLRVLLRNAKIPNSECFSSMVLPVMRMLEESADEMRGDSAETRKETKMLIGELERVLNALDKQTEGALTSEFLSNVWSFVDEEHNGGEEGEDGDEESEA